MGKLKMKISARMPQEPSTSTRHSDNRGAGEHSAKRPQGSTHSGRELCFRVEWFSCFRVFGFSGFRVLGF